MIKKISQWINARLREMAGSSGFEESPDRYKLLRRNLFIIGLLGTVLPLSIMAAVNHHQYKKTLKREIVEPLRVLVNKTTHSFELFLAERISAVSFIASAYTYRDLANEKKLNRIFRVVKQEFGGFVDLGLIDSNGLQVSYTGPYKLKGKNYSGQAWFHEVKVRGTYTSDVFMGYRKFPHFVIAVESQNEPGKDWVLRATIDTDMFSNLITAMGLEPSADAFIINREGVLQTPSKFYGRALEKFPLTLPPVSHEPNVLDVVDNHGKDILMAYAFFKSPNFALVLIKPRSEILKAWYTLKGEILLIFLVSVLVVVFGAYKITDMMVRRIEVSDQRREAAFREVEHSSKLASIGRLAAGVAHEINNPLAIIRDKAGLMKDLIEYDPDVVPTLQDRNKFMALTASIKQSVDRCRAITHRLLGFARRMDVQMEPLDLNEVIREVLGFLEQEAFHRDIDLELRLSDDLPRIVSDRSQLQQVFLNILNNAFAAVDDGGAVGITSWAVEPEKVAASIHDTGCGMSPETLKHIFEPFFTTKKGSGTGLGLSISYGIINKLGGNIEAESIEGEGTTFTVFLPRKKE